MRYIAALCLVCVVVFGSSVAQAQRFESIAVIVNDDVITYGDVYDRMSVVIRSSNLPDSKNLRKKMMPQVVDTLVTEQLQLQEAKKLGIKVGDDEVEGGFRQVAEQNKLDVDAFKKILKQQGMPETSMARQIASQIAWGKVVQQKLRPQVVINDSDVNAEISRMRAMSGKSEFLLAEILLPVLSEADESKIKKFANNLVVQMKKGASFSSLARQFSASSAAAQGGMIGWVTEDSLDPAIATSVASLAKNNITAPIRTNQGYHIMLLLDKRVVDFADPEDAQLTLKELILPFSDEEGRTEVAAKELGKGLTGCFDIEEKKDIWEGAQLETYNIRVGELPEEKQSGYLSANIGAPMAPVVADGKVSIKMVCSKEMPKGNLPDFEGIRQQIGLKRMDVLSRSYLQDLKMQSYIENRME